VSFPYLSTQRVRFGIKNRNKGRDFGSKIKAFIHSYISSTSFIPSKTPKTNITTLKPYKQTLSWSLGGCSWGKTRMNAKRGREGFTSSRDNQQILKGEERSYLSA